MQFSPDVILKAVNVALEVVKLRFEGKLDVQSFADVLYKGLEDIVQSQGNMSMAEFEAYLWKEIKNAIGLK